jgi:hypothetical protein
MANRPSPLGPLLVEHEPDEKGRIIEAPREATYALYRRAAPGEAGLTPQGKVCAQVLIASGQPIGFEQVPTGDLQGVAGEQRIPLSEGEYAWFYSEPPAILPDMFTGKVGKTLETVWEPTMQAVRVPLTIVGVVLYFCPFLR